MLVKTVLYAVQQTRNTAYALADLIPVADSRDRRGHDEPTQGRFTDLYNLTIYSSALLCPVAGFPEGR
jgi:hypothetical protein